MWSEKDLTKVSGGMLFGLDSGGMSSRNSYLRKVSESLTKKRYRSG